MVLVIDIGNTNVVAAVFKGQKLIKQTRLVTDSRSLAGRYRRQILKFLRGPIPLSEVKAVVISSVVPAVTSLVKKALIKEFGKRLFILGENTKVPIVNKYKNPSQVGQDRLVNAFAVLKIYKRKPAIIVDFGTAVTIDAVSNDGAYLGGIIVPGVELSLENLSKRAALLPRIALKKPHDILGKSTKESMLSGIFYGYGALCDGLIDRLKKRLKADAFVVATGGHSRLLSSYCRNIDKIDPALTLTGLNQLYITTIK